MKINKKFIIKIMKFFNAPQQKQQEQQQRQYQQKQTKPGLKIEDIHAERLNAFEKGLAEKKNDFLSAMTVSVPEIPKFSDNSLDEPIGGAMEELIARTLAQRNFEIESIHGGSRFLVVNEPTTSVFRLQR
jgi:hypothetical protein